MATYAAKLDRVASDDMLTAIVNSGVSNREINGSIYGETYYVDQNNGSDTSNGTSWERATATIAAAITLSNTYIAVTKNSKKRNTIYVGGSDYAETLATLPNQCDMIGVGNRTGWNTRIQGVTTVTTAVTGCHIYNFSFYQTTAAPNITIPAGSHGFWIYDCDFYRTGALNTDGIQISNSYNCRIANCVFRGNPVFRYGIVIKGAGFGHSRIVGNQIYATGKGIKIEDDVTGDYQTIIKDNIISSGNPNSDTQLLVGIDFERAAAGQDSLVIRNYISAVDAINWTGTYSGNRDQWQSINNWVNEGATASIEDGAAIT